MTDAKWKIGDRVQLISGGPSMTVNWVSEDGSSVECVWFGPKMEHNSHSFHPDAVKKYELPRLAV